MRIHINVKLIYWIPELEQQIVGNIGLYYVSYRLSQLGWNVMPTARNAKGIDLVAYDLAGKRLFI